MQSTLTIPKPSDDPHDVVVVAPDAVRVAPPDVAPDVAPPGPDDELSSLLQQAARQRVETPARAAPDFAAAPTVPPVDATFRPSAVDDILAPGKRGSLARRATRAFMTLLLAAGIVAAFALRSQGDAAKQMIAQWTPPFVLAWLPTEKPESAAPPAAPAVVQANAANAAAPQPAPAQPVPPAPAAAGAVAPAAAAPAAPSPETAQLQSMTRDLASLGQEVEQLKASIEQLKAGQQQVSRDAAKASEQNLRARIAAIPSRPSAALPPRPRKPTASFPPPQAAIAPAALPPPAAAPYYAPRQLEPPPQATGQQLTDPELASVPRPPMPVR